MIACKSRAVEDGRTGNIWKNRQYKEEVEEGFSLFLLLCVRAHLYALCMQSVCIPDCIHFRALSPTDTPIRVSVCIVCSQFRSYVPA